MLTLRYGIPQLIFFYNYVHKSIIHFEKFICFYYFFAIQHFLCQYIFAQVRFYLKLNFGETFLKTIQFLSVCVHLKPFNRLLTASECDNVLLSPFNPSKFRRVQCFFAKRYFITACSFSWLISIKVLPFLKIQQTTVYQKKKQKLDVLIYLFKYNCSPVFKNPRS